MLKVLIVVLAVIGFAYYAYINFNDAFSTDRERVTGCTLEAKICTDGTVVGRTGPNCEFKCPTE